MIKQAVIWKVVSADVRAATCNLQHNLRATFPKQLVQLSKNMLLKVQSERAFPNVLQFYSKVWNKNSWSFVFIRGVFYWTIGALGFETDIAVLRHLSAKLF